MITENDGEWVTVKTTIGTDVKTYRVWICDSQKAGDTLLGNIIYGGDMLKDLNAKFVEPIAAIMTAFKHFEK
jgi:hypothetical protein